MACGTPVIGADVGGIRHSVAHGTTGWLVPPNDPDAIAERAAELFRDPERLKEFGRNAIRRVNSHFTWQKVARSLALFYEEVAAGTARLRRASRMAVAA
jgi:D-inositol-3-phosphate glycosyltransferase